MESRPVEGTYVRIGDHGLDELLASIPLVTCDVEIASEDEAKYRLLAEYLAAFCAKGDESLDAAFDIDSGGVGFTFLDEMRDRRAHSPNMNWEGLNIAKSFVAVGTKQSDCPELRHARQMSSSDRSSQGPDVRILALHFEVEHMTGAKNMVSFNFEERPGGAFFHWGLTVSNYFTVPR